MRKVERIAHRLLELKHLARSGSREFFDTDIQTGIQLAMSERASLTVSSRLEDLSAVQQWFRGLISRLAAEAPWVSEQFDQLNLALAEGFTNAVRHAHANLPSSTPIEIELSVQPKQVEICIFDHGGRFDPDSLKDPQPGVLKEGGYGWFLLRRLADQVTYDCATDNRADQRNCLRIVKTSKIS